MQGAFVILGLLGVLAVMSLPRTIKKILSDKGMDHLKFLEGERLTVYRDSADIPTVGVGHKVLPQDNLAVGDTITQAQSDAFLRADLKSAEHAINSLVKVPLNQNQFDSLTSFVFNIGINAFRESTLLAKLNQYDYQGALAEMERWRFSTNQFTGQKEVDQVLVRRRQYEQDLFVT